MNKWDERFLKLAKEISTYSKDPSTQCGCVIVNMKHEIISTGYNGFPAKVKDTEEKLGNREYKYKVILHAEENAIRIAKQDLFLSTLYTYPFQPCAHCSSHIIANGICRVVAPKLPEDKAKRWKDDIQIAIDNFKEAGVILDLFEFT